MKDWNLVVTIIPGPRHLREVLRQLGRLGWFASTSFKDVCVGKVEDVPRFLEDVLAARTRAEPWANMIARVIPVERTFTFTPDSLADQLQNALAPLLDRMQSGTFCVRIERRGLAGRIPTQEIERAVAAHIFTLAEARGTRLETDFGNPDYILAAETLGDQCGVTLILREQSSRYPFLRVR